ncbi:MAG TPA: hypothetical protein VEL11_08370 [Candidatus Bathyarchaeia archaeon]|nr:hypothetical protein [Candidatus Bathyarchaeia archaeon]
MKICANALCEYRFGGDYYYILCCATVNDDKLDQALGYGHSDHSSGISFVHPGDEILYNNYKVRCATCSVCATQLNFARDFSLRITQCIQKVHTILGVWFLPKHLEEIKTERRKIRLCSLRRTKRYQKPFLPS